MYKHARSNNQLCGRGRMKLRSNKESISSKLNEAERSVSRPSQLKLSIFTDISRV